MPIIPIETITAPLTTALEQIGIHNPTDISWYFDTQQFKNILILKASHDLNIVLPSSITILNINSHTTFLQTIPKSFLKIESPANQSDEIAIFKDIFQNEQIQVNAALSKKDKTFLTRFSKIIPQHPTTYDSDGSAKPHNMESLSPQYSPIQITDNTSSQNLSNSTTTYSNALPTTQPATILDNSLPSHNPNLTPKKTKLPVTKFKSAFTPIAPPKHLNQSTLLESNPFHILGQNLAPLIGSTTTSTIQCSMSQSPTTTTTPLAQDSSQQGHYTAQSNLPIPFMNDTFHLPPSQVQLQSDIPITTLTPPTFITQNSQNVPPPNTFNVSSALPLEPAPNDTVHPTPLNTELPGPDANIPHTPTTFNFYHKHYINRSKEEQAEIFGDWIDENERRNARKKESEARRAAIKAKKAHSATPLNNNSPLVDLTTAKTNKTNLISSTNTPTPLTPTQAASIITLKPIKSFSRQLNPGAKPFISPSAPPDSSTVTADGYANITPSALPLNTIPPSPLCPTCELSKDMCICIASPTNIAFSPAKRSKLTHSATAGKMQPDNTLFPF